MNAKNRRIIFEKMKDGLYNLLNIFGNEVGNEEITGKKQESLVEIQLWWRAE